MKNCFVIFNPKLRKFINPNKFHFFYPTKEEAESARNKICRKYNKDPKDHIVIKVAEVMKY